MGARGLLPDIETLHLDRGYDSAAVRATCASHGITDVRILEKGSGVGGL